MKKLINIPDEIIQDLELETVKAKKGRKRYQLSNYITDILVNHVNMLRSAVK